MVEYTFQLNDIFGALADPTRRDILQRLQVTELNVTDIAAPYDISLAAVSKHLKILEKAQLIIKRRQGKEQYVTLTPAALLQANDYLKQYERSWIDRLDRYVDEDSV